MSRPRRTNKPTPQASRIGDQVVPAASASRRQKANAKKAAEDLVTLCDLLGVEGEETGNASVTQSAGAVAGPPTARNTRHNITTPSLAEIQAIDVAHLPKDVGSTKTKTTVTCAPRVRGLHARRQSIGTYGEILHTFADKHVEASLRFIKDTKITPFTDDRHNKTKHKPGRPAEITTLAILVALHLLARENRPLLITEIRDVLFVRLTPGMQGLLSVKPMDRPVDGGTALQKWHTTTYFRVLRAFHRFLKTIDPSVDPKSRVRTWAEIEALKLPLTEAEIQERRAALTWVANRPLEVAHAQLPDSVRKRLQIQGPAGRPGYALDGTPIPSFARGRGVNHTQASADPDSGWYVRTGDHRDPADGNPNDNGHATVRKAFFGREAHLLVTGDMTPGDRQYAPHLPLAFVTDRPGVDPSGAARRLFANLADRGHKPGYLAGDLLYTNQSPENFQIPARTAGYDLVLDYTDDQLGLQETHASGMKLIDGRYYAPCIPPTVAEAIADLRAGRITGKQFGPRIQARKQFEMRTKAKPDTQGLGERLTCPAAGPNPTAICALKPKSQAPRPIRQPDGRVDDLRPVINHLPVLTNGAAPTVCRQEAVSVSVSDGAKFRQPLRYETPEQKFAYRYLRQGQEGIHGSAKDESKNALAAPARRRVLGMAAMEVFAGFILAEVACRRIKRFLEKARTDENGDLYVPRVPRSDDRATTPNPAGATPPPGPEPGGPAPRTDGAA